MRGVPKAVKVTLLLSIIVPVLQMATLRLGEVKELSLKWKSPAFLLGPQPHREQ